MSIALGTYSAYRNEQGHLLRFGVDGSFLWARSFGWLVNPLEVERAGVGGPVYELVVDHSIYDDGPFWMQAPPSTLQICRRCFLVGEIAPTRKDTR